MMPIIIHKFYSIFGYLIEIRIQTPNFQRDLERLSKLADERKFEKFKIQYDKACQRYYPGDCEMIMIDQLSEFLNE